jgi:hypothetical protein
VAAAALRPSTPVDSSAGGSASPAGGETFLKIVSHDVIFSLSYID